MSSLLLIGVLINPSDLEEENVEGPLTRNRRMSIVIRLET
jgi:hypothetical protein